MKTSAKRSSKKSSKKKVANHSKASRASLKRLREMRAVRALYEHNAATGIALLIPFTGIVLFRFLYILSIPSSDSLATFYQAWIFSAPVVFIWAVLFPVIALWINASALITIVQNHRYNGEVRLHVLIRDVWPSLAIVGVSLSILTMLLGYHASTCVADTSTTLKGTLSAISGCEKI